MSTVSRNRKVGGTNAFETEYQTGFTTVRADEVDADFDTLYTAWNTEIPNAVLGAGVPPSGSAGGDLTGVYPTPAIAAGAVTRAKTAADLWLVPIPTGPDVGKVLGIGAGPALTWVAAPPPIGPAGGDLTGSYPNPTLAVGAVGNAEISDVAWAKVTGAPTSLPPSGSAGGALTGTYPNPTLAAMTSAQLAALVTDETGSGKAVFATSPTFTTTLTTPKIDAASGVFDLAKATTYAGMATVGFGLPAIVYAQSWTNQGADIGMLTPVPVAGAYRLNFVLVCEVAAAGAGAVVFHAQSDYGGAEHYVHGTPGVPLTTVAGSIMVGSWPMNCTAAGVHFYVDHTGTYSTAKWGMTVYLERLA